ncbi:DVU_1551 family NTP transferase [Oceanidesulfovibrio marinus]|uniref:Phosphohydrolase n=1 Tax=Oceanidesulfovibrio marinus TaxID=370038 RepID=A0A6P1ZE16_9BACT|nr:NTP transferase domain-containing protein [Oceanidesulfovibrio marinus]TVM31370.1 phosphohydrolase [Oceanidesulfovibrio marinus]
MTQPATSAARSTGSRPSCAGVVLAAGYSSRMGELGAKPLFSLGGSTVLERAVDLLRQGGADSVIVVLGHRAEEVVPLAERAGAEIVFNTNYPEGMFSSVQAALRALEEYNTPVDAAAFLPTDCCLVRSAAVRALYRVFADSPESIIRPSYRGSPGHPIFVPAHLFSAVQAHDGRQGLRGALESHPMIDVPVWDRHTTWDMDTPEDYARAQRAAARLHAPTAGECLALLEDVQGLPPQAVAHGKAVARVARLLAEGINKTHAQRHVLDLDLVTAAGLLHDIAKGEPHHETEGGHILRGLGLDAVAAVTEEHRDLTWKEDAPATEREVVYLADKLVRGPMLMPVEQRFAEKIAFHADDPAEVAAIRGRLGRAQAAHDRLAGMLGQTPFELALQNAADRDGFVVWSCPDDDPAC